MARSTSDYSFDNRCYYDVNIDIGCYGVYRGKAVEGVGLLHQQIRNEIKAVFTNIVKAAFIFLPSKPFPGTLFVFFFLFSESLLQINLMHIGQRTKINEDVSQFFLHVSWNGPGTYGT